MSDAHFDPMENEDDETELDATVHVRGGRKSKDPDAPIESSDYLPIFPDYDKNAAKVIMGLDIYKLTPPNDGFRGQLPPQTTLQMIGRLYGDGVYNIHAVNQAGKVLRRRINEKITVNVGEVPNGAERVKHAPSHSPDMALLNFQREAHREDAQRMAAMSKEASEQSRALTENHLKTVERTTEAQIARDREFMAAQLATQQTFFQSLFTLMHTSHVQQMEAERASRNYTLQVLQQSHERMLESNNPMTMLALFREGMQTGAGMASDNQDPLQVIASSSIQGLKEIKQIMALKSGTVARKLPSGTSATSEKPGGSAMPPLEKLQKFRALLDKKGLTVEAVIDDLTKQLESLPDEGEDEEDAGETEQPSSQTPPRA